LVHSSIMLGGIMREAAVAFCAFALLVGAPIAILAWLGSAADRGERGQRRRHQLKKERSEADLWRRTLLELQPSAVIDASRPNRASAPELEPTASRPATRRRQQMTTKRRILAHSAAAAATLGLLGCADTFEAFDPPPPAWEVVRPGMGTAELTALVGPPQQIKSNGSIEVWQYCRKSFLERDGQFDQFGRQPLFKRRADYYVAVWVENEQVKEVKPYPVVSRAGCDDFFQAVW
jgi:hypothetical protein